LYVRTIGEIMSKDDWGKNRKFILTALVIFAGVVTGYADVKNKSNNNEKDLIEFKKESREDVKIIQSDIKNLLAQNAEALTILKEWKKSN